MAKILVCRCEDVTLQELVHGIEKGYADIESLKRYTGFGTGWCQGKSCLALCARILREKGGTADLPFTPRPPVHPVTLGALAGLAEVAEDDEKKNREPRETHAMRLPNDPPKPKAKKS